MRPKSVNPYGICFIILRFLSLFIIHIEQIYGKRMNVTRLMPLIYPFICYFVQKRLFGGKSYFVEKRLSVGKLPFHGKTTTPTPSAPEAAGVLNFLCALRLNTPPPNIP